MQRVASALGSRGYIVTSEWLAEPHDPQITMNELTPEQHLEYATTDLNNIIESDAMLFFSEDPLVGTPRGGRHFEQGYAQALNLQMFVVGPMENIFHYLPNMKHYDNVDLFFEGECS